MIYSLCYILSVALFGVILKLVSLKTHGIVTTPLLIFLITFYSIIIFNIINIKNIKSTYSKLLTINKIDVFLLPALVSLSLTFTFYIPLYYTPAIHSFAFMAIMSCCASLSMLIKAKTRRNFLVFSAMLTIIVIFYILHLEQMSLTKSILLVVATMTCAITSYLYFVLSYKFNEAGFRSIEVLSFRFWPICIVFGIISFMNGDIYKLPLYIIPETIGVSLITFALPVYFSQKAIEKIGPELHGTMLGFTPLLTFVLENMILKIHDFSMLFFGIAFAVIILCQNLGQKNKII